jgi:ribonuclease VapC
VIVDASALIAILDGEADAAIYAEALAEADVPLIPAATLIEAGIVMVNRHGPEGLRRSAR